MCKNSSSNDSGWLLYGENNWAMQFRKDISELDIEEIEPIVIEKINLMLGSYPYGYRVTLKDFHVHGLSNLTVNQIKSNLDESPEFQMTFLVQKLSFTALSRVLIMFAATGGGEYWGEFEDIEAAVYMNATGVVRDSQKFLHLNHLELDFNFGTVRMGIKKTNKKNKILESALNLFINAYAIEFLKEIKPCLKTELTFIVKSFIENWFNKVPVDNSYLYCNFNGQ
uniref:Uncharacterized protein n=2 Tax=Sipha flava TaxID=143950 RepID=A0A2S2QKY3_9HEMI